MEEAIEKKKPKQTKASKSKKRVFTPTDIENAIIKTYKDVTSKISIKHLWVKDGVHRIRVNWWEDDKIKDSKFLHVNESGNKVIVREVS